VEYFRKENIDSLRLALPSDSHVLLFLSFIAVIEANFVYIGGDALQRRGRGEKGLKDGNPAFPRFEMKVLQLGKDEEGSTEEGTIGKRDREVLKMRKNKRETLLRLAFGEKCAPLVGVLDGERSEGRREVDIELRVRGQDTRFAHSHFDGGDGRSRLRKRDRNQRDMRDGEKRAERTPQRYGEHRDLHSALTSHMRASVVERSSFPASTK
jgi:hypothetical protein